MAKVHIWGNKKHTHTACATRSIGKGRCVPNARSTYRDISSPILAPADFYKVDPAERCAHCCDRALQIANRQRREAGKPEWTALPYNQA